MIIKAIKPTSLIFSDIFNLRQAANVGCFFLVVFLCVSYMSKVSKVRKNNDMLLIFLEI